MKKACMAQNDYKKDFNSPLQKNFAGLMKRINLDLTSGPRPCNLVQFSFPYLCLIGLFTIPGLDKGF